MRELQWLLVLEQITQTQLQSQKEEILIAALIKETNNPKELGIPQAEEEYVFKAETNVLEQFLVLKYNIHANLCVALLMLHVCI